MKKRPGYIQTRLKYIITAGTLIAFLLLSVCTEAGNLFSCTVMAEETNSEEPGINTNEMNSEEPGINTNEMNSEEPGINTKETNSEKPGVYAKETASDEGGVYTKELAKRSQVADPEEAELVIPEELQPQESKTHTVMIYMVGSNLESRLGCATKDIEEMIRAGLQYETVNVLVYTGGSRRWIGEIPCDRNCVLDLSKGISGAIVAQTEGNADMGAAETLSNFVNFCTDYYPAEHYSLILWDHGGGPLWGYGADELYDSDSLLLEEQKTAMNDTIFAGEEQLDFIGFDACLMGSVEGMAIWKNYADYYIGSEETEPGDGWDYTFLSVFETTDDPVEEAAFITECYGSFYERARTATHNPDITLACIDLSKTEDLIRAFNDFAGLMIRDYKKGAYSTVMQKRAQTKGFGLSENLYGYISYYYDLVDLGDLAVQFEERYPEQAAGLLEALNEAKVCQASNVERASGISLYFPFRNKSQFKEMRNAYKNVAISSNYTKFLDLGTSFWLKSKWRDWELGQMQEKEDEYTISLTSEQMANCTSAYYSIICESSAGGYIPYMTRCSFSPDKKGVLHLPKDLQLAVLRSDSGETLVCPVTEVESDEDRTVYRTENTGLRSDMTYVEHIGDLQTQWISLLIALDHETEELSVLSVNDNGAGMVLGGKSTIDVSRWEGLVCTSAPAYVTRGENGVILPFGEWNKTGVSSWSDLPLEEEIGIELVSAADLGLHLYCQIEIEDVNGEYYASELCGLTGSRKEVTVDTSKGTLTYAVYEDHAEVVDYSGRDKKLILPDTVEGKPLTVVGDYAFGKLELFNTFGTYAFEEVSLPDSIESIGTGAFYACGRLKSIRLPANLKKIGSLAFCFCDALSDIRLPNSVLTIGKCTFAYCTALTELELPPGLDHLGTGVVMGCKNLREIRLIETNAHYTIIDGSLYTADGKALLAFPAAAGTSFTVAQGTEEIIYGAFASSAVESVKLPDSLRKIGNYAFYACDSLKAPVLPEGLTEIGMHAFDTTSWALPQSARTAQAVRIFIGPDVSYIGEHAFDGFMNKAFLVDPQNTRYSSSENSLLNGAGDTILSTSINKRGQVIIPEGVAGFDFDILDFLDNLDTFSSDLTVHLYLPESVARFPETVSSYETDDLFIHCPKYSAAENFAIRNAIPFSNEMSAFYQEVEEETEKGVLTARVYTDYVMITRYAGEDSVLEIPDTISGKPVKVVGDGERALSINKYYYGYDNDLKESLNLAEIHLPEGVLELNKKALDGFAYDQTVRVELPQSLQSIEEGALTGCTDFVLPEGLERLGKRFTDADLKEAVLTPSLRYIDPEAFADCRSFTAFLQEGENETYTVLDGVLYSADLKTLICYPINYSDFYEVPEGCEKIGERAFYGCRTLQEISLPVSLKQIDNEAFYNCRSLETIRFAADVMDRIGSSAFRYCEGLTQIVLPAAEEIGADAFHGCSNLTDVTMGEGVLIIGESAFGDTLISNPNLPDSIRSVKDYAFRNYYSKTGEESASVDALRIGRNLTEIGFQAFANIRAKEYAVDENNEAYRAASGMLADKAGNVILSCPSGMSGEVYIPEGFTAIADYAFYNDNSVNLLHIPDSVEYIGAVNFRQERNEDGDYLYQVTICCSRNSFAHRYAVENDIPFRLE